MMHSKWAEAMLQAYTRHSLSRAALVTAGAPIFLLDTFTSLILYYTPGYPSSIPFPPPHSSLLRRTIQAVKQSRQISPQLKMVRGQQLLDLYNFCFPQSFQLTHYLLVLIACTVGTTAQHLQRLLAHASKIAADVPLQICQTVLELEHSDILHTEGQMLVTSVLSQKCWPSVASATLLYACC